MAIRNNKNIIKETHIELGESPTSDYVDQDFYNWPNVMNTSSEYQIIKTETGVDEKGFTYTKYYYYDGINQPTTFYDGVTWDDKGNMIGQDTRPISKKIRDRIEKAGVDYHASDNIADFIEEGELDRLVDELTQKFDGVLETLIIDPNDPNSRDTGRRMAKMYIHEQLFGRYYPKPKVTAFPNEGARSHNGMLVVPADIKSMCSHHHKDVKGICYIGIIPGDKVIGLSKYARIAWHCARRGTLQEELTNDIAREIAEASGTEDVIVWIKAEHGCMSCRGILTDNSATVTMVTKGAFDHNQELKRDFLTHINMIAGSGFKCS